MRNLLHLLSLVFFVPLFSSAQANYQPGLIVNLQGDTVRGAIDYNEWQNNPEHISFKATGTESIQKLDATEIKFFSAHVGHLAKYVAYDGPISTDVTNINHLSVGRDSSYRQAKVFLKIVQEGKNQLLLSYSDDQKTRFFIASNYAEKPVELIYRIFYNESDDNAYNRTSYDKAYKSQLYQAAVNAGVLNNSLKKQIVAADYNEADLVQIASTINGISATDLRANNPEKHRGFNKAFAIIGGLAVIIFMVHDMAAVHGH
jgi:hypothetical protein